jgi:hypothetical protein
MVGFGQALEKRTRELQAQVAQLQTENTALSAELTGRIKAIETEIRRTTMRQCDNKPVLSVCPSAIAAKNCSALLTPYLLK